MEYKTCSSCRQVKPTAAFGLNRQTPDGLMYYCRNCNALKQKAFRQNNPDAAKASKDRYLEKLRAKNDARHAQE